MTLLATILKPAGSDSGRFMADTHYDYIVLGKDGVGSAALQHLASRGEHMLGLDKVPGFRATDDLTEL